MLNETRSGDGLRRAMANARLRDVDVATHLKVDTKTVQRWLNGRLPQTRHRWALADYVGVNQFDLWPHLPGMSEVSAEVHATYNRRANVPREAWLNLLQGAEREISIVVYSGLFLAEDIEIVATLRHKASEGVDVRLLLGDPDSPQVAERGREEHIGDALAAKIRNALVLFRPLVGMDGIDLRLHRTMLHSSLYVADNDMMVNQHVYGLPSAYAPVLHLRRQGESEIFSTHLESFDRIWLDAVALQRVS